MLVMRFVNRWALAMQTFANEQMTFKQVAEDMKFWGMQPNRDTVRLHKEFVPTACPHRSWELHGKETNAVKTILLAK